MERSIKYIVVHCTATPVNTTIASIQRYWKQTLGWKSPGYHYIIQRNGTVVNLLPEAHIANGVKGYNSQSIHLAYIGGVDSHHQPVDNRSDEQRKTMQELLLQLSKKYPQAAILGHRDFPGVAKACPSFDVRQWLETC